jgi:DNA-binding SARP family transcriptional activator
MMYLHTLGDALIRVGEKDIRPTAPLVFAALLYLGVERGRRVPRAALQELLFPNTDERSGAHSLRQLLYKLRQLGAPIEADTATVRLSVTSVDDDSSGEWTVDGDSNALNRLSLGLLPGYQPSLSSGFELWLEDLRAAAASRIRTILVKALSRARGTGDQMAAARIASALLKIDPLNEEATLARAEVLALGGQKRDAVRMLEEYSAEVGGASSVLRISPEVLRRRIDDRISDAPPSRIPLVGRQDELSWLLAQFARATAGNPTVTVIWGDAGIGKTRLVQEFRAQLLLKSARIVAAHCEPHDVDRPLGAFIQLVPALLDSRGALGVAPASHENLLRFAGRAPASDAESSTPELVAARIREAVEDLLVCVAAEDPLLLLVEDAHWLDRASLRLLLTTALAHNARIHLLLTLRNRPRFPAGMALSESAFVRQLEPLGNDAAAGLLAFAVGDDLALNDSVREQCLSIGAGNPLFLCTIAEHLRLRGAAPSNRASILDLLRQRVRLLEAQPLLLLRCVAALGNHGTPDRIAACSGLSDGGALLALQDIADRGLVVRRDGVIKCSHELVAEGVLLDAPIPIRVAVFERVAAVLEEDGVRGKQVSLLWSCAEAWRLAENGERAARMLQRCAEFALEIGQPVFACTALEKAQDICAEDQLVPLIEETIRFAELACDPEIVSRNVSRYKAALRSHGLILPAHHFSELADINALRQRGKPAWHFSDELRRCALDQSAPASHRLKAATTFLLVAVQNLAKTDAVALYSELGDLRAVDAGDAGDLGLLKLRMFFNVYFGDMGQAGADAQELLAAVRAGASTTRVRLLGDIASAFFYSGSADAALEAGNEAVGLSQRLGLLDMQMFSCARLSNLYFCLGDAKNARTWQTRAERLPQQNDTDRTAFLLSNRIGFALQDGDCSSARRDLGVLRNYSAAKAPHAIRTIRGLEILIDHVAGSLRSDQIDFEELERLDDLGRAACEHHVLALALFTAYVDRGLQDKATQRLREYVCVTRRERYALWPYFDIASTSRSVSEALKAAMGPSIAPIAGTAA